MKRLTSSERQAGSLPIRIANDSEPEVSDKNSAYICVKLSGMKGKHIYLLLALVGALIPYFHFGPWLLEHGLDMRLFFDQVHANRVSEFFVADVVVSAAVVLVFLIYERRRLRGLWWVPIVALLIFGVSVSLPVLLYLREGHASHPD